MKKTLCLLFTVFLTLSLLAACGNAPEPSAAPSSAAASESEKVPQTVPPAASTKAPQPTESPTQPVTEPVTTPEETMPQGPVALDQVIYEGNGLRIIAVSYEDHLDEMEQRKNYDSVFDLQLRVERTGDEPVSVSFPDASVNGFTSLNYESFLGGISRDWQNWLSAFGVSLSDESERDGLISITKQYAEQLSLKSVGELAFLLNIKKEDGPVLLDAARLELGQEADPKCPVIAEEGESNAGAAFVRFSNPSDVPMTARCVFRLYDAEDDPIFFFNPNNSSLSEARLTDCYVFGGAESVPASLSLNGLWLADADGELLYNDDVARIAMEYFAAAPDIQPEDRTKEISWTIDGRADWNDSYVQISGERPEGVDRVIVNYTLLCYDQNDQLVKAVSEQRVVDWAGENPNNSYIFIFAYKSERDPEYRFEFYVNRIREDPKN